MKTRFVRRRDHFYQELDLSVTMDKIYSSYAITFWLDKEEYKTINFDENTSYEDALKHYKVILKALDSLDTEISDLVYKKLDLLCVGQ